MMSNKTFNFQGDDKDWLEFKRKIEDEGQSVELVLSRFVKNQSKESEKDILTPSKYTNLLTDYLLTLDLSNTIRDKKIHISLQNKEFYYFVESVGVNLLSSLQESLTEALRLYWCHASAEKKGFVKDSDEYKQLETKWNLPKLDGFKKVCDSIKITFDAPCVPYKVLSDFTTSDIGKVIQTNITIIGPSARKFDTISNDYFQKVLIQELNQDAKHSNPQLMKAYLHGKHDLGSGQTKRIIGCYRLEVPEQGKPVTNLVPFVFDIYAVQDPQQENRYVLSNHEIQIVREFAESDEELYIKQILDSFAPHITGRDLEKLAIILSILGGSNLGENRNESHLMLVGEADTAKSELLRSLELILSNYAFIDGSNATGQSLGYALDEYEGTKFLRAGALIQHNHGVVGIDEYDKMPKPEQKKLNRAMEQQSVKYDKAGFDAKAETKTTIIAACNPVNETWHSDLPIIDNLPFDSSTFTRFDNIIRLSHNNSELFTRNLFKHIFKHIEKRQEKSLSPKYLGALLEYLKQQNPVFSDEAKQTLEDFFTKFKKLEQKEGSLPMQTRQVLGLIRLCTAYAKLTQRKSVDNFVVSKIIDFYKSCLNTFPNMVTDVSMQIDLRGQSINKDEFFKETFAHLAKDAENGLVSIIELSDKLLENPKFFKTEKSVTAYIEGLKKEGYLYEPHNGRLKRQ